MAFGYRLYFGIQSKMRYYLEFHCASDDEAIAYARSEAPHVAMDLWQDDRLVERFDVGSQEAA